MGQMQIEDTVYITLSLAVKSGDFVGGKGGVVDGVVADGDPFVLNFSFEKSCVIPTPTKECGNSFRASSADNTLYVMLLQFICNPDLTA